MAEAQFTPFPTIQPSSQGLGVEQRINAPPAAFGESVGGAEEKGGAEFERTGAQIASTAISLADIQNTLWANNYNTETTKKMGKQLGDFLTLQGRAAVDGVGAFTDSIQGMYKDALAAAPNLVARERISTTMRQMGDRYITYGQEHAARQGDAALRTSYLDSIDENISQAVLAASQHKPADMVASLDAAAAKVNAIADRDHYDPETRRSQLQRTYGEGVLKIVQDSVTAGESDKAQVILDQFKDRMDAKSLVEADKAIKKLTVDQRAQAEYQKAIGPTYGPAPASFTDLERQYNLPQGYLTGTYAIESNSGRNVGSEKKYKGAWQFDDPTAKAVGVTDPDNFVEATQGAAKLAASNMRDLTAGLGYIPTAGELYIAHQEGSPKAIALLKNPDATAASIIGLEKVKDNLPKSMAGVADTITAGQFTGFWAGHFEGPNKVTTPAETAQAPTSASLDRIMAIQDPQVRAATIALWKEGKAVWDLETKSTRDELMKNVPSLIQRRLQGEDVSDQWPGSELEHYLPERAAEFEEQYKTATTISGISQGLRFDSAPNVTEALLDLQTHHGPISEYIAGHSADPWEFSRQVSAASKGLQKMLTDREKALRDDSAQYTLGETTVNAAAQKAFAQGAKPEDVQDYAQKTLIKQSEMGVEGQFAHVLPKDMAERLVQGITSNPTSARGQLMGLAKQFGYKSEDDPGYWPHVFNDLTMLGKLPADYQGLLTVDPSALPTYTKVLQEESKAANAGEKFSWDEALGSGDKRAGGQTRTQLDMGVEQGLAPYIASIRASGASEGEVNGIVSAAQKLAYGNSYFTKSGDPAGEAVQAFVGKYSYMLQGGARVPSDVYDTVSANAGAMLDAISANNIRLPRDVGQPGHQSAAAYLSELKYRGQWVTSPDGSGLMLMSQNGYFVRGLNGKPIQTMFRGNDSFKNFALPTAPPETGTEGLLGVYRNSLIRQGISADKAAAMTSDYAKALQRHTMPELQRSGGEQ